MQHRRDRSVRTALLSLLAGLAWALPTALQPALAEGAGLQIQVLSNRADLLSGGTALVALNLPEGADLSKIKLDVNGNDVTANFALRANGRFAGLLQGLPEGRSQLTARLAEGSGARIALTNHPLHGPVFAGPQVMPWFCDTEAAGLGPSESPYCEVAAPVYTYFYVPQNCLPLVFPSIDTGGINSNCLMPEYDPENPPTDVSTTTTDQGKTVPFVIRVETGVIDRGIYKIAALWDPANPVIEPWTPRDGYNGKVLMTFGGDCTPRHSQGQPIEVRDARALSHGFAVMTSNLNILGHNCNDVVSAESLMMLKEYFIETYGEIRYTMSNGASGGSIQQHWIVSNYPGLLDGIQPAASFPDIWQVIVAAQDCHLLERVFNELSPTQWLVVPQRSLVHGYASPVSCLLFNTPPLNFSYAQISTDPDHPQNCQGGPIASLTVSGPAAETGYVYNAQTNPTGERCTLQDYQVALWGRRPEDGFANRPYDNTGVQYGLQPLESGLISAEQFVDLNEKVGGIDIDWNFQPQRSVADAQAVEFAYRGGRITQPREAAKVPIMDLRGYSPLEIHTDVHSYSMRARFDAANGHHDNQIIWNGVIPLFPDPASFSGSFEVLDRWLSAIEADTSNDSKEVKVLRNKPGEAVDACWIAGQKITDMAVCRAAFPYFGTPRIAAGGPLADDIFKCQLKPLRRDDYRTVFTDAQWTRLQAVFTEGVCDYGKLAAGQQPTVPWLSYAAGPGGQPIGDAPQSQSLGASAQGPAVATRSRFGGAWGWLALLPFGLAVLGQKLRS